MYSNIDTVGSSRSTSCICWGGMMSLQHTSSLILLHIQKCLKRGPPLQCSWSLQKKPNNHHMKM